jgi:DNA-binding response OmpR family regulator
LVRLRLLLVDEVPARRLAAAAALSAHFDVLPLPDGEDPVRSARTLTPDLAIISLHPRKRTATLRLVRILRTDVRPVGRVGVVDRGAERASPAEVTGQWLADGYFGGDPNPAELTAFALAIARGERPVTELEPPLESTARRILRRLRG